MKILLEDFGYETTTADNNGEENFIKLVNDNNLIFLTPDDVRKLAENFLTSDVLKKLAAEIDDPDVERRRNSSVDTGIGATIESPGLKAAVDDLKREAEINRRMDIDGEVFLVDGEIVEPERVVRVTPAESIPPDADWTDADQPADEKAAARCPAPPDWTDADQPAAEIPRAPIEVMRARRSLESGAMMPYDASDAWRESTDDPAPLAKDWAHAAARGVIDYLIDRAMIKLAFYDVGEEIRVEIVSAIAEIVRVAQVDNETKVPGAGGLG